MFLLSSAYFGIAAAAIGYVLWQVTVRSGGGNHWVYFGTTLDQLVQTLGFGAVALAVAPHLLACGYFAYWGQWKPLATPALFALFLAVLTWWLVFIALD